MKKLFKDTDNRICAYIFAEGIVFRFERSVKVGQNFTKISCFGIVRKKINCYLTGGSKRVSTDGCKPFPYLVPISNYDLLEKTVLSIKSIEHWVDNSSDISLANGIRNELINLNVEGMGIISGNLIHGIPGYVYPMETGCVRPLYWTNVQDLESGIKAEQESGNHPTLAFDIDFDE